MPAQSFGESLMSMNEHHFQVPGASCEHCINAITTSLLEVDGVYEVDVNLESKTVTVRHDAVVNTGAMRQAIEDAGYEIDSNA